jgi:hypothetical protein
MEEMFVLKMTQANLDKMKQVIDIYLKLRGLDGLTDTVELVNILASAQKEQK